MAIESISMDNNPELIKPQENYPVEKAPQERVEEPREDTQKQNVQMEAGINALKEAIENDPVAQFVNYTA